MPWVGSLPVYRLPRRSSSASTSCTGSRSVVCTDCCCRCAARWLALGAVPIEAAAPALRAAAAVRVVACCPSGSAAAAAPAAARWLSSLSTAAAAGTCCCCAAACCAADVDSSRRSASGPEGLEPAERSSCPLLRCWGCCTADADHLLATTGCEAPCCCRCGNAGDGCGCCRGAACGCGGGGGGGEANGRCRAVGSCTVSASEDDEVGLLGPEGPLLSLPACRPCAS